MFNHLAISTTNYFMLFNLEYIFSNFEWFSQSACDYFYVGLGEVSLIEAEL